jgi:hypothetical protein
MTGMDFANAVMKQKEEKGGEDDTWEEVWSNDCVSHNMMLQCSDTLLDYMEQRRFKCSNITATRNFVLPWGEIWTVHRNKQTLHNFYQSRHQLCKKMYFVMSCECNKNNFFICVFQLIVHLLPLICLDNWQFTEYVYFLLIFITTHINTQHSKTGYCVSN